MWYDAYIGRERTPEEMKGRRCTCPETGNPDEFGDGSSLPCMHDMNGMCGHPEIHCANCCYCEKENEPTLEDVTPKKNTAMEELTAPVKDFELVTGAFLKHYCRLGIKCFYSVMENTWDGKHYKDLVLYVSTPDSKDMYKASQARNIIVNELVNTENCFMGDYSFYEMSLAMLRDNTVISLRKYDDDKELY